LIFDPTFSAVIFAAVAGLILIRKMIKTDAEIILLFIRFTF